MLVYVKLITPANIIAHLFNGEKKKSTCFLPQGETPHAKRELFLQEPSDMGSFYHSIPIHLLVLHIIGKLWVILNGITQSPRICVF